MAVKVMVAHAIVKGELAKSAPAPRGEGTASAPRTAPSKLKKRRSAVYDADGNEVLITLMCQKCHKMRPLSLFGLRKMSDGTIRNQPWCRNCRSGAGASKVREEARPGMGDAEDSPVSVGSTQAAPSPETASPEANEDGLGRRRNPAAEIAAALAAGRG